MMVSTLERSLERSDLDQLLEDVEEDVPSVHLKLSTPDVFMIALHHTKHNMEDLV